MTGGLFFTPPPAASTIRTLENSSSSSSGTLIDIRICGVKAGSCYLVGCIMRRMPSLVCATSRLCCPIHQQFGSASKSRWFISNSAAQLRSVIEMIFKLLFLVVLPVLASAGPLLSAVVYVYNDDKCSALSPAKSGLSNPAFFASTCSYYQSGPPNAANSVSVTFQSCTSSVMKLNTWPSVSTPSCVGISNAVSYDVGVCTAFTDASGVKFYYKVTCSPASALSASLPAALLGLFLFLVLQ